MCHHDLNHHHDEHTHHHGLANDDRTGVSRDKMAECPVMPGNQVVKAEAEAAGLVRDYQGQRYWLCCPGCGPTFDADPAKYATA
ncbi:YHS domain-containing protein [Kocuria sp. KH4]